MYKNVAKQSIRVSPFTTEHYIPFQNCYKDSVTNLCKYNLFLTWTFSGKCTDVTRFFQRVTGQPNNSKQAQNDKLVSGKHCELKQSIN